MTRSIRSCRRQAAWKLIVSAVAAAHLILGWPSPADARDRTASLGQCSATPVSVSIPQVSEATVYSEFCLPKTPRKPRTVEVLVHGATYDHQYWDLPGVSTRYSYVDAALRAGHATLAVDNLGVGRSSHPASSAITVDANASALHQVIAMLKEGRFGGRPFSRIVGVGHSLGVAAWWREASLGDDVDAFVLMGQLHQAKPSFFGPFGAAIQPASGDPKFSAAGLDPGYLTTAPGTRDDLFYNPGSYDPAIAVLDERELKQTVTSTELGQSAPWISGPEPATAVSQAIHAPTLLVVGQNDPVWCGAPDGLTCSTQSVTRAEGPYYQPAARPKVLVVPNSGHCLQLERLAPLTNTLIASWIETNLR